MDLGVRTAHGLCSPKRVLISASPLPFPGPIPFPSPSAVALSSATATDHVPCHAMPRTISSRGDDAASLVPDAMMLSQSINWIGRCLCRSLDRDGSSPYERLCSLAAGDAGIPGSRAPTRCLMDCEGTGRSTAQVLALCTRVLTCGERTRHCLAPLLAFPFLNHAKSLRNDP